MTARNGPTHWTETFFDGAWLDVQRAMHSPQLSAQQAEDLCELLELDADDRVLDAPCGEGRIALALAELGMDSVGIDTCQPLLDDARQAATQRGLSVRFENLDLRKAHRLFNPAADTPPFDAAVCIWGSFGYFGDGGVHGWAGDTPGGGDLAFARAIAQVLRPGGHFVIDTPGIEMLMARYQSRGWFDGGDIRVLEQRAWDPLEGVMHVEWTLVREDEQGQAEVSIRHSAMRIYSAPELARLLSRAGFRGFELCGDLAGNTWSPGDRMVMVATR